MYNEHMKKLMEQNGLDEEDYMVGSEDSPKLEEKPFSPPKASIVDSFGASGLSKEVSPNIQIDNLEPPTPKESDKTPEMEG